MKVALFQPSQRDVLLEVHQHKCCHCGVIWGHSSYFADSQESLDEMHTCPRCGKDQRTIYYQDEEVHKRNCEAPVRPRDPMLAFLVDVMLGMREPKDEEE